MFAVTCARGACGKPFEAKTARAKYCSASCRALDSKDRKTHPQPPSGNVVSMPGARGAGTIRAAVVKALSGQADSVAGRQALKIAERLDQGASDSAWANLSRRLDDLLEAASRAAALAAVQGQDEDNPVAFLKARAEKRRAAG